MPEYVLKAELQHSGMRLDMFLFSYFENLQQGLSRSRIQVLIREGNVSSAGRKLAKPHQKVKPGQEIRVGIEERQELAPQSEDIPVEIIYEDADLAVINKPPGLVVHPAPGNDSHTLVNALLHCLSGLSDINPRRPGIVHRLDKETSGVMVVAKNNFTHLGLVKQFARHTIKRKYVALVRGKMEFDENIIELPIGRHPVKRKSMAVSFDEHAKSAKTYYRTVKRANDYSLLELEPFTGRTHQLRVHLAYLGHPILGDSKYGRGANFPRLALHALSLGFNHPRTGKFMEFNSEMPKEFRLKEIT